MDFVEERRVRELAGSEEFQASMDKLHDWFSRNSVKKTMLKHEQIFREQVYELHRLYGVQKSLMAELRNNEYKIQYYGQSIRLGKTDVRYQCARAEPKMGHQNSSSNTNASAYQYNNLYPVGETCIRETGHWFQVRDFTSQNATCVSRDTFRSQRNFNLERPTEECASDDVSTAGGKEINAFGGRMSTKMRIDNFQARSSGSNQDTTNVELTLGTGGNGDVQKKRAWWECPNPEFASSLSSSTKRKRPMPSSNVAWPEPYQKKQSFVRTDSGRKDCNDPFDRENLQQAPWMFQALPLHRRS